VANLISHSTTANKVVWGKTSIEVNLLSWLYCWVANLVSYSTTTNKVVWGQASIEVNILSRILLRISLAKPKEKSKMSPTDPVEEEEKAEVKVEAELRSKKEEENLGKASPKDISDTHQLLCSAAILDDLPDKMGDLSVPTIPFQAFASHSSSHH
jgi:hypothetical protein